MSAYHSTKLPVFHGAKIGKKTPHKNSILLTKKNIKLKDYKSKPYSGLSRELHFLDESANVLFGFLRIKLYIYSTE
ncbi:hypothetical protein CE91St19_22320 [Odoribacter laneus]|nr:hypothetical protein CE91St19_22320 [Odoribacter laneus]GKI25273.1 hypothetical protein CE91St20_14100 [Odoribacter laneus]